MEIVEKALKRVYYIALKGRLDAETSPQFDAVVDAAMHQGRFRFVLDLSEVPFISSRGLKSLLRLRKEVRRFNRGDIHLVGLQPNIREVLTFTGLDRVFLLYDSAIEAVGDF